MPQIINPYGNQKTMGDDLFGLGGVADAFFGPKASTAAFTREKFKEQQRQNIGVEDLATLLQNPNAAPGALAAAAARGNVSGTNLGQYNQFGVVGRAPDIRDPSVARSVLQAGGNYATTPVAFDQNLQKGYDIAQMQSDKAAASQQAIADRTMVPILGADGKLTYSRSVDAPGQGAPVTYDQARGGLLVNNWANLGGLQQPQQSVLGADKRDNAQNWVQLDAQDRVVARGRTYGNNIDADTNQPLPSGALLVSPLTPAGVGGFTSPTRPGTTEQKDYREAIRHADQTTQIGNKIIETVNRNPTVVGPVGNFRRMGQEGMDLLNSLNTHFGGGKPGGYESSIAAARLDLRRKYGEGAVALLPELFDPDLNSITTMNGMLIYKAAAAMGQSGRDASDKDIAKVTGMVGRPDSWFQGPNTYKDKVGQVMSIIGQQRNDDLARLEGRTAIAPGATGAPGAASPPGGGGTTSTGVPWTVGP